MPMVSLLRLYCYSRGSIVHSFTATGFLCGRYFSGVDSSQALSAIDVTLKDPDKSSELISGITSELASR